MQDQFQAFVNLIEFAATADTVEHLETLFDLIPPSFESYHQDYLKVLIHDRLTDHPAY